MIIRLINDGSIIDGEILLFLFRIYNHHSILFSSPGIVLLLQDSELLKNSGD